MDDRTVKWIAALAALGGLYWIFGRKSREVRVGAFTNRERKHLHASEHDWDKPAVGFELRLGEGPWRWPHHEPRRWEPWPSWRVQMQPRQYFPVMPERHYYPARRPRVQVQEGYAPEMDIQPYPPPPYAAPAPPPASSPYAPPQYATPAPPPAPPPYAAPAPPPEAVPYEQAAAVPHGIQPLPPPPPHAPSPHAPAPPHPPAPSAAPPPSQPQGAGVPTSPWWQSPPLLADQQHMSPEIRSTFEGMTPESQQSLAWQSLTTGRSMEEILRSGG